MEQNYVKYRFRPPEGEGKGLIGPVQGNGARTRVPPDHIDPPPYARDKDYGLAGRSEYLCKLEVMIVLITPFDDKGSYFSV